MKSAPAACPPRSALRDAAVTGTLPDRRVLELYVNYAQFGPHLYGICAASWYYFGEPPWSMTAYQSAQLMGVLQMSAATARGKFRARCGACMACL